MKLPRNCPFCGANATQLKVIVKHQFPSKYGHAYVRCLSCNARGPLVKGERISDVELLAMLKWGYYQP